MNVSVGRSVGQLQGAVDATPRVQAQRATPLTGTLGGGVAGQAQALCIARTLAALGLASPAATLAALARGAPGRAGVGVAAGEPLDCAVQGVEQLDDERECDCHVKSSNESEGVGHRQDLQEERRRPG